MSGRFVFEKFVPIYTILIGLLETAMNLVDKIATVAGAMAICIAIAVAPRVWGIDIPDFTVGQRIGLIPCVSIALGAFVAWLLMRWLLAEPEDDGGGNRPRTRRPHEPPLRFYRQIFMRE